MQSNSLLRITSKSSYQNGESFGGTEHSECPPDRLLEVIEEKKPTKWTHFVGIFLAVLMGLLFTYIGFIVKYLKFRSSSDMSLMLALGCVVFALPLVIFCRGSKVKLDRKFFILVFLLALFTVISINSRYTAIKILPMGEASAIIFSAPIFTAFFARILLKEKISRVNIFSILVSFLGVLLVAQVPHIIKNTFQSGSYEHSIGCVYAFSAVIAWSLSTISGRKLRYVNIWVLTLYQGVVCVILISSFSTLFSELSLKGDCSYDSWLFASFAVSGFLANVFFVLALKFEDPVVVSSIVLSTDIITAFLVQFFYFGDPLNVYSYSGASLVFIAGLLLPFRKWVLSLPNESIVRSRLQWMNVEY